jgi:enamine deaminase RidA (YjgF/YER057c/UK114 family)
MPKTVEHIHWPDAPDLWMPYAPAIKVKGGTTVYLAGVTAAPVYHHHPHRPEEFDAMPRDMAGQARAALENLKRGLDAVGARFADVVTADRFVTDLSDQDALNRVWAEFFAMPSRRRPPCKWCGSPPIRAAWWRSMRLR